MTRIFFSACAAEPAPHHIKVKVGGEQKNRVRLATKCQGPHLALGQIGESHCEKPGKTNPKVAMRIPGEQG